MQNVTIYTMRGCPYCMRAKELLARKGVKFKEIDVQTDEQWAELEKKTGRDTVPQIYIGKKHIPGCDALMELEKKGELDKLLRN